MSVRAVRVIRIVLIVLTALQADGRMQAQGSGILVRHQAPTDRAFDVPLAALQAEFADMKAQQRASTRLLEGGTYSMNARYLTGRGVERVIKPGDVIFIPPGVPHAIRQTTGISYLNIHFGGTD